MTLTDRGLLQLSSRAALVYEHEAWNRGAYLVEVLGHCGECHTPRTISGTLDQARAFAGNPDGPDGESVPNITSHPEDGIGNWSEASIATTLKLGMLPDGDFVGSGMGRVVSDNTGKQPDEDIQAIVAYLKSLPPLPGPPR